MTHNSASKKTNPWKIEPLDISDPKTWPPEVTGLTVRRLADGRRVVTGWDFAALLGCTTGNLPQLKLTGACSREVDLDEPKRSWYRLEVVARVYLTRNPGAAVDDEPFDLPDFLQARPAAAPATEPEPAPPPAPTEPESDEHEALIRGLAAELAETRAELARLKATIEDPSSRRGLPKHLRRFSPPKG